MSNSPRHHSNKRPRLPVNAWQLQTAKARFSELFRRDRSEGPQLITRHGTDGVIMIPVEQFAELIDESTQNKTLVEFFRESPLAGLELELKRQRETERDIEL